VNGFWGQIRPIPVVYGAVDLAKLADMLYGSADPIDVAFRICADGVEDWVADLMRKEWRETKDLADDIALFIADDYENKVIKTALQRSFRSLRKRIRPADIPGEKSKLLFVHDDMYFGDSKYSVGIQLADLCSYFIGRHLNGDIETEGFYKLIEPHIVYSRLEPSG